MIQNIRRWVYCEDMSSQCPVPRQIQVINELSFVNVPLGIGMLLLGTLSITWYIPCIIALCSTNFTHTSCYRLLTIISFVSVYIYSLVPKIRTLRKHRFLLGAGSARADLRILSFHDINVTCTVQMDIFCLMFNACLSGLLSLVGVPFCGQSRTFIRIMGALAFCKYRVKIKLLHYFNRTKKLKIIVK
jgi:hypothetical protein